MNITHGLRRALQVKSRGTATIFEGRIVAAAANDPDLKTRTWVLLTEAVLGGWGLWEHAHTNEELISAARTEIARLQGG